MGRMSHSWAHVWLTDITPMMVVSRAIVTPICWEVRGETGETGGQLWQHVQQHAPHNPQKSALSSFSRPQTQFVVPCVCFTDSTYRTLACKRLSTLWELRDPDCKFSTSSEDCQYNVRRWQANRGVFDQQHREELCTVTVHPPASQKTLTWHAWATRSEKKLYFLIILIS